MAWIHLSDRTDHLVRPIPRAPYDYNEYNLQLRAECEQCGEVVENNASNNGKP